LHTLPLSLHSDPSVWQSSSYVIWASDDIVLPVANIDFMIDIANVFNLMMYRSSLINSPMDVVSIESSMTYSEQGHNDEVSLVTYTFPQITYLNMAIEVISNLYLTTALNVQFPLFLNPLPWTFSFSLGKG
jgi:hypothetical protein